MEFLRLILFFLLILSSCSDHLIEEKDISFDGSAPLYRNFRKEILFPTRESINAGLQYNSTDYYVYNGDVKGFNYDLIRTFAKEKNYQLGFSLLNIPDTDQTFEHADKNNVIAVNTHPLALNKKVIYSDPVFYTDIVLVSSKNKGKESIEDFLKGKIITVPSNSYFSQLARLLRNRLRTWYYIVEQNEFVCSEKLLKQISKGCFFATITNSNTANSLIRYIPNLYKNSTLIQASPVCWTFNKESGGLAVEFNRWLHKYKEKGELSFLYKRYYNNASPGNRLKKIEKKEISVYDPLFQKEAGRLDWDWKFLAAIAYTESRFNDTISSSHQAYGLMQIMEESARQQGVMNYFRPDSNIYVAVRYLKYLDNMFQKDIKDPSERINFILASYNAGWGHIYDAMRLAKEYHYPHDKWKGSVENFLMIKSLPEFRKKNSVRNGYCNAVQIVNFIDKVKTIYKHYLNKKMMDGI